MLHLRSVFFSIILCSWCLSSNFTYVYSADIATVFEKVVHMCNRKSYNVSLFDCLKERSLIGLDSIYRSKNDISLIPNFLSLVPNDNYHIEERTGKNLLMDIESQSPQNRSQMLDNLIAGRAFDFLASRSVSIKVPFTTFDVFGLLNDNDNQTEGKMINWSMGHYSFCFQFLPEKVDHTSHSSSFQKSNFPSVIT